MRRNTVIVVLMAGMMLLGLSVWSADPAYAAGKSCFRGNVWITKVTVAKGVTGIDDYAFEACSSLKSASLPSSALTICKFETSRRGRM